MKFGERVWRATLVKFGDGDISEVWRAGTLVKFGERDISEVWRRGH